MTTPDSTFGAEFYLDIPAHRNEKLELDRPPLQVS